MIRTLAIVLLLLVVFFIYSRREMFMENMRSAYYISLHPRDLAKKHKVEDRKPLLKEWYTQKIPFKIHQTDYSRLVDYGVYKATRINQQINPEYEFLFYGEDEIQEFMRKHFPQYLKHYNSLVPGAFKADLFRLLVLYQEGGVYLDSKSYCISSLREMIKPTDEVYTIIDVTPGYIYNGFMCSTPGHPLIKTCIDKYISNIEKKSYGLNVYDIGGPLTIGRMFNTFFGKPELSKIEPFEKDGVHVAGLIKSSSTGEDVIVSEEGQIYIERSNSAYKKRKIRDMLTGKCYGVRWFLGTVFK